MRGEKREIRVKEEKIYGNLPNRVPRGVMAARLEEGADGILDLRLQAMRNLSSLVEGNAEVDEKLGIVPSGSFGRHDDCCRRGECYRR